MIQQVLPIRVVLARALSSEMYATSITKNERLGLFMGKDSPDDPHSDDEVLSFLDRVERFIRRLNEGILVFIFHRIPKWTYETLKGLLTHLSEYFEWLIRFTNRLARICVFSALFLLIVLGPPMGLFHLQAHPIVWMMWLVTITAAILFAFQRYVRKEIERRNAARRAAAGAQFICAACNTAHKGASPPAKCGYCGSNWVDGDAGVSASHRATP